MVCFQTNNPNLGKFWRVLLLKILVYFMTIWSNSTAIGNILWPFGIFLVIWYIVYRFGILDLEKSGNPGLNPANLKL
jgi:hypothetical protein